MADQQLLFRILGDTTDAQRDTLKFREATLKLEDATKKADLALEKYGAESMQYRKALLQAEKAQDKLNRSQRTTARQSRSIGSMLASVKAGYFAVATAVAATAAAVITSVKAYALSEAAQVRLQNAVRNAGSSYKTYGSELERVIKASSRMAAVDDEEVSDALATLVQNTKDVTKAQELLGLALDVSRAKKKDLGSTAVVLGKVYNGNVGALKRFGVQVKEGSSVVEAFAQLQDMAGGAAEAYGASTAGAADKIGIEWENLQESAGQAAVKVGQLDYRMNAISNLLGGEAFTSVEKFGQAFTTAFQIGPLSQQMKDSYDAVYNLRTELPKLTDETDDAATANQRLAAALGDVTTAANETQDAELTMLQAQEKVKDKRKALNDVLKEHGKKSREARIATLELKIAQREAAEAAQRYNGKLAASKAAAQVAKKAAQELAERIDRIRRQANLAGDALDRMYGKGAGKATREAGRYGGSGKRALGSIEQPRPGGVNVTVAEAGSAEAIIPINNALRSRMLLAQTAKAMGYSISNANNVGPVNVTIAGSTNMNSAQVQAAVETALNRVVRRSGQLSV